MPETQLFNGILVGCVTLKVDFAVVLVFTLIPCLLAYDHLCAVQTEVVVLISKMLY